MPIRMFLLSLSLILSLPLLAPALAACPDLAGTYLCQTKSSTEEKISISQEVRNGVVLYTYNGAQFPADNKVHPIQDDDVKDGTMRSWCVQDGETKLKSDVTGKISNVYGSWSDFRMSVTLWLEADVLRRTTVGYIKSPRISYPIDHEEECARVSP
ncbi:MAG: hypothetical protein HC902_00610 [Calothrix sp. SM1_5_4]|nr:hypothetical protein [Calothrix sp. SM1_5_4]